MQSVKLFGAVITVFTHSGAGGLASVHDIKSVWKEQKYSSSKYYLWPYMETIGWFNTPTALTLQRSTVSIEREAGWATERAWTV